MDATPTTATVAAPRLLVARVVAAMRAQAGTFGAREGAALALANALVREWTAIELAELEATFPDEVRVEGARYRRHEPGTVEYHALSGGVAVRRWTYRRCGVHNGRTIVPLELAAGLRHGATPALAYAVAQGYAQVPLRQSAAELEAAHRVPPSRSTLERLAKHLAADVARALPTLEPTLRAQEAVPREGTTISLGLDRTTVPMAEAAETTRRRRRRPYVRQPPPPVAIAYRMAYVGTVALHDATGAVLFTRRFTATALEGPSALVERIFDEVAHLRRHRPRAALVIVQDGAPELWGLVRGACQRRGLRPTCELIDRYHVEEHLDAAIAILAACDRTAAAWRARYRAALDRSDTAMDRIARDLAATEWALGVGASDGDPLPASLRGQVRKHIPSERCAELAGHIGYLVRNRRRMRYATARAHGFPIGSGVTEGACKSVVTARVKRSGQRWGERGLSGCLRMRALRSSFDAMEGAYTREIRAA